MNKGMNRIMFCKVSVMLKDNLSSDFDYLGFIDKIAERLGVKLQIFSQVPQGMNSEQIASMPVQISRAIGINDETEMQISPNNFVYVFKKEIESLPKVEKVLEAVSEEFSDIGANYALRYRLGVILTIITNREALERNVESIVGNNLAQKPEWQLSYLDKLNVNDEKLIINKWKYYICNDENKVFKHDLDINTSVANNINIRDDLIKDVYKDFIQPVIKEAYDEFK